MQSNKFRKEGFRMGTSTKTTTTKAIDELETELWEMLFECDKKARYNSLRSDFLDKMEKYLLSPGAVFSVLSLIHFSPPFFSPFIGNNV